MARGSVEPDATVDLHGHTLTSAHGMLDLALERSRARGDRVILLITGKPPRRDSELDAFTRQSQRNGAADAAGCAGDQRSLAHELQVHIVLSNGCLN